MKLLILNGPNLSLLGMREPEVYGTLTLKELNEGLTEYVHTRYPHMQGELEISFLQSNSEGTLIDALHKARLDYDGIVFNPAAYTHYSYALRDAIAAISLPVVEVHLSDIDAREDFRRINVIRPVCIAHFQGEGARSYERAIDFLLQTISIEDSTSAE